MYDTIPYGDDVPEEDRKYKTLRDALFAGVKVRYEGAFETILTRTVVDEVVEISSLSVVDRYQLYSRDDRVGVVTKFDKDSHWFQIKLNTSGTVVKCKREDFTNFIMTILYRCFILYVLVVVGKWILVNLKDLFL